MGGIALLLTGGGLVGPAQAAAEEPTVQIRASDRDPRFEQTGAASVELRVMTLNGGRIGTAQGRAGVTAMDFPSYVPSGTYPRAVLAVTNTGTTDQLSPGTADFTWGADFRLDATSQGRSVDNGDNLIQRGLWSQASQYKAQVDSGQPACSVKGSRGRVTVRLGVQVRREEWYGLRCIRTGDRLTAELTRYLADGSTTVVRRTADGAIGSVRLAASVPLSIGGKLAASGSVASSTDQFNGLVSLPMLRIG